MPKKRVNPRNQRRGTKLTPFRLDEVTLARIDKIAAFLGVGRETRAEAVRFAVEHVAGAIDAAGDDIEARSKILSGNPSE